MAEQARDTDRPIAPGRELLPPGEHDTVVDRLGEVVRARPEHVAVESGADRLTYAELDRRARSVAGSLVPVVARLDPPAAGAGLPRSDGAPSRAPVGILASAGCDSTAAFLGVLATGHPAVLLDPLLPTPRIELIAQRAGVEVVLADPDQRARAEALPGVRVVRGLVPEQDGGQAAVAPADRPVAEDPASVMFTSGTTGLPKGVAFGHGTFLASALFFRTRLGLGPGDRMAMTLPWAFAAGQELTVAALLNGATVCVRDLRVHGTRDAVAWMRASRVTTLHGTPSLMRSLMGTVPAGEVLDTVRMVTTAGEKLYGRDVEAIRAHVPAGADVVNYIGSSETGVFAAHVVPGAAAVPEGTVPAGTGTALREATVVGDDGRPVAAGEVGELHLASRHLSRGYWDDPETTRKRFTSLPDGRTGYLSGDRARIDAEGVLHVLGRADDAVKIRGYLVEPSEVEAALRRVDGVADTVVRALHQDDGTARLVAWVAPDPLRRTPSPTTVRTELSRSLPDYMVPRDVVLVPSIPKNSNGKADPAALPEPPPRPEPVPPRTAWEQRVERVWASVLGLEHVGRDESFTALGGDSLAVEEVLTVLSEAHRVTLTTADLAEHPTLESFAARAATVAAGRARSSSGSLVRLRTGGTRPPVHCFAGAGAQAAYFEALADQLGPDQPVNGFQVNGFENVGVPDWTVRRTARRYVRAIRGLAPEQPAVLVGHSLGGLIALEAAHLLSDAGVAVPLVVLLDTYLPPRARPDDAPWTPEVHGEVATVSRGLWRTRLQVVTAGLWPYRDAEVRKDVFHEHGTRIAHFHRPRPWAGRTLLFTSIENGDDPAWWSPILVGEHEVHRMPCDHLALLRRPFVDDVARRVAAEVDGLVTGRPGATGALRTDATVAHPSDSRDW